jgi:hypothetical protein
VCCTQGDGESVPETPPNEAESLKPQAAGKAAAASAVMDSNESVFKLRLELDGMASILLILGVITRLFRYCKIIQKENYRHQLNYFLTQDESLNAAQFTLNYLFYRTA